ncbi:PRSS16 isoform 11 [Pongo abelii]|uniref:PRSS16 isoform 11 n=1 Tax=Pongo abelii TaxID=9601 RepID=A0A2J8SK40_PONAB|nr:PRSS16 isoform 11 [Pongo abelii]
MRGHPAALAPAWGALVISLEHRFYGLSIPAGGLEMAQLRFLSSRHALADVVSARLALSRLFNISSSSPWICFGGSYAGSLAAWARLKFPHLIFASVASSAPVRAVLDFSEYNDIVLHSLGQKCLSFSRAETVAQLRSTEPQLSGVGDRQWLYQTCTEFGFYVTCENPRCPFSQLPALPSQLDLCEQVFGLSALSVAQAVAQTNSYYGGQTPGANQVLFVNGDTDPWHVLSVTQALGSSESTLLIRTGSHCLDMAPERPSDSPSLRLGRQNIFQQLQTWLKLAKESQIKGEV